MTNRGIFIHDLGQKLPHHKGAILWVHGYTLSGNIWEPLITMIPDWHHVVIDLPGHGQSKAFEPSDDLISVSEQIYEIARACDVEHIVGLSLRISVIANACFGLFRTPGPALFLFPYFYSKCSDCASFLIDSPPSSIR